MFNCSNRLLLFLLILPFSPVHGFARQDDDTALPIPKAPSKSLPDRETCRTTGKVYSSDASWALETPFKATVQLDMSDDVNKYTDDAFMCFSYGTPACKIGPSAGTLDCDCSDCAKWTGKVARRHADTKRIDYTFTTYKPGGMPQGSGKGIIIITKAEPAGTTQQYKVDDLYKTIDINNPKP